MATGIELIAAERTRQVEQEGYTAEHDDGNERSGFAKAAATYALCAARQANAHLNGGWQFTPEQYAAIWPWGNASFNPKTELSNLVRAGALIAAAIDHLQREASKGEQNGN